MRKQLIISLIILILVIKLTMSDNSKKIDAEIYGRLSIDDKVPVIVVLKETSGVVSRDIKKIESNKVKEETLNKLSKRDFNKKDEFALINAFTGEVTREGLEKLKDDLNVLRVEYDYPVRAFLQDSVPLINATLLHNIKLDQTDNNITGKDNTICIIDSGVNYSHVDLGSGFGSNFKVLDGYDYVNTDADPIDDNGHGTHVAGIAAANGSIVGVAPEANIVAIKVLDNTGVGSLSALELGIEWCITNSTIYNITVISMSLGTLSNLYDAYCDSTYQTLSGIVQNAIDKNITVVAATGNLGNTNSINAPACLENVTAIGWSDKTDTINSNSNRNNITDLFAPGSDINSTAIDGGYTPLSGTSMATPHVAGIIALLQQYSKEIDNINLAPFDIINLLKETGTAINDTSTNLDFPRVDAYNATNPRVRPEISNNTYFSNETIQINFTVGELTLKNLNCTFYLNGAINETNESIIKEVINTFEFNLIEDNEYNYTIECINNATIKNSIQLQTFTLDTMDPIVNLEVPENNTFSNSPVVFNFTAIDTNLDNCSLFIDGIFNQAVNATNNTLTSFEEANLTDENYLWNVQCFDKANRNSWNDSNFTIKVDANPPLFSIDEPKNTTYPTDIDIELNFTIIETNLDARWYNLDDSENISLSENVTFNTTEGSHTLKLYANDTLLRENITSVSFSVDLTNPVIVLISPQNSSTTTSSSTTLSYNVSDAGIASCSLIIDNSIDQTDSSIEVNIEQSFTKSFSSSNNGLHTWNVNCTDNANRENSSEIFDITVSISSSSGGSGGSGGGGAGGASGSTETQATETQLEAKKEAEEHVISFSASEENLVEVIEDDRISFKIKDNSHLAIINDVTKDSVTITISSEPITITLKIKEIKTIDLDNDNINDLSIKLEDIIDGTAVLIFKEIKIVETKKIEEKSENITEITAAAVSEKEGRVNYFIILAVIIILIITLLLIMKRRRLKIKYLISRHKIRRLKEKDL